MGDMEKNLEESQQGSRDEAAGAAGLGLAVRLRHGWTRFMGDVRGALATMRAHPFVVASYCAYVAWMQGVLFGQVVRPNTPQPSPLLALIVPAAFIGLACLAVALVFRHTRNPLEGTGIRVLSCVSMCLGSLFQLALSLEPSQGAPGLTHWVVYVFGWVLIACGTALFRVEMDRMLGWFGATKALYVVTSGSAILAVVLAGYLLLPAAVAQGFACALPLAASLLLNKEVRSLPRRSYFSVNEGLALPIPWQFVLTSLMQGVVSGVFYGGLAVGALSGAACVQDGEPLLVGASYLVGAGSVLAVCCLAKFDFNRLIYKVGFPMLAVSLVLLALAPGLGEAAGTLYRAAAVFTDLVLWSLGAYIIKDMGMPACWIASLPGAALFCGTSLGAACAVAACSFAPTTMFGLVEMPLLAACLLLVASLFLLSERNMRSGWGTFRIGTDAGPDDDLDAAVALLAGEMGLTAREADVVGAFARRMTRKEVAEALCVGDETVKTHLRGIYRKTDVHGQDELVSLVEKTRRSMRGMG